MKVIKIVLIIFFIFCFSNLHIENVYAASSIPEIQETGLKVGTVGLTIDEDKFDPKKNNMHINDDIKEKVNKILGWINTVASVVSVAALMIIGVKYIMGSLEEKAKYKETMFPYVVGCIMVAAGTNLVTFIYKIFY